MAYVGREPRHGFLEGQTSTFNGSTTTVTLQRNVSSTDAIDVYIDNVHQEPDVAYTLSSGGDSITFTGTPENGAKLYVRFHGITFDTARANRLINTDGGSTATLADNDTFTMSLDGTTVISASSSGVTIPNLTVTGTTTSVNSTNLEIGDNKITLNSDVASNAAPSENAGIIINRGSSADVQFLWNETNDEWYAGNDLATGGIFRVKGGGTTPTLSGSTLAAFTRSAATNNASIAIIGNSGGYSSVHFGDENDEDVGQLNYNHTADAFSLNKGLGVTGNINVSGTITASGGSTNNDDNANILTLNATEHARLLIDTSSTGGHRATLALESNGNETQLTTTGSASYLNVASGDLTLDGAGGIIFDTDNNQSVKLKLSGTHYASLYKSNDHFMVYNPISNGDIRLQGKDGSSVITALTLDMSEAGKAIFNNTVGTPAGSAAAPAYTFNTDTNTGMFKRGTDQIGFSAGGTEMLALTSTGIFADKLGNKSTGSDLTLDAAGSIILDAASSDINFKNNGVETLRYSNSASGPQFFSPVTNKDIIFKGKDDTATVTALTLDMSEAGRAIFNAGLLSNNTNDIRKAQITSQYDSSSFLRLHPSATTNSGGYTNMFFGTSTDNNYGVAIGGVREGTDGTPSFAIRMHNDSIVGTKVLTIDSMGRTGIGKVPASSTGSMLQIEGNDGIAFRRPNQTNHFVLRPLGASGGDGMRFTQEGVGDRMVLDASGNVSIGSDDDNPFNWGGSSNNVSISSAGSNDWAQLSLKGNGTGGTGINLGSGSVRHAGIFSLDGSTLAFATNPTNSGTTTSTAMTILSNGNVDIAGVLTNDAKRIIDHPTQSHALAHYQELVCHNSITTSNKNTWMDVAFTGHSCIFKVYGATLENNNNALGGARLITNMLVTYGSASFTQDAYKVTAMNGGGVSSLEYRYLNSGGNAGSHRLQVRVNWSTSNTVAVYTTITGMSETLSVAEDN
jgi:hypothetical protein